MNNNHNISCINILNIKIQNITSSYLLEYLDEGVLFTPNVDHLVKLQKDKEFYDCYQKEEWVICDSRILFFHSFSPKISKNFNFWFKLLHLLLYVS